MERARRDGNKRNSASFDSEVLSAGAKSSRQATRTTAASTSRQDVKLIEALSEKSYRVVTPDPSSGDNASARSAGRTPTSPSTTLRTRAGSSGGGRRPPSRPLITAERPVTESSPRPRTQILEGHARNPSPARSAAKGNRTAANSISRISPEPVDPSSSSIGFPSIVSATSTPGFGRGNRLVKSPPPRPLSPPSNQPGLPMFPIDYGDSVPSPTSDTSRIFSLMKTTCGRMHGILSFRSDPTGPWASGYCAINVASGSLIYQESKGSITQTKTLIPDLRGCHVRTQGTHLSDTGYIEILNRTSGARVHLRPHVPETFASWLAALLCWQPLQPKSPSPGPARPPRSTPADPRPMQQRRNSSFNLKEAATIKIAQMLYWDHNARVVPPVSPRRISTYKQQRSASGTPWRRVSATLQSNGLLKLYLEKDNSVVAMIPLASLCRSAIQRLHPSVLEDEYCIGIYPQYTTPAQPPPDFRNPVYLSLETRILYEAWFVLFKAFTIPELYGPQSSAITSPALYVDEKAEPPSINTENMFRLERNLTMRVTEAKLRANPDSKRAPPSRSGPVNELPIGDYHAEVFVDGEIRGRTAVKIQTRNPFWREDYHFSDLPAQINTISVVIKSRNNGQRDWTLISDGRYNKGDSDIQDLNHVDIVGEIQISPLDNIIGTVTLNVSDIERCKDIEDWFHVLDDRGERVGDMLLKIRLEESIVLMSQEYRALLDLLQQFSSGLTQQIVSTFPATELRQLPETLLNIFQVSGTATEWLASLVEDEIDSIDRKPTSYQRFRYSRGIAPNEPYNPGVEREVQVREDNKNANVEANLLFRGNSLLTKALDTHMKRVGTEYLEVVLGDHMRDIDESDPDCEVNPLQVPDPKLLEKHWYNLIVLTENVWNSIAHSVDQCPSELRVIFRRIRSCAEDRYGVFRRNVGYSSVSGFLFLRFICAAVLNPKLFGLLKDHPRPRAQRTLTLMAKSLQTLANMTTFGGKEPWMERMNGFLTSRRQEFKNFVDNICTIPADRDTNVILPNYATPSQIRNRLPETSREGFPSLPYLLDISGDCAALVSIWIDATSESAASDTGTNASNARDEKLRELEEDRHIVEFDSACHSIRAKIRDVLARAEQLGRPSGVLEVKWEELVAHLNRGPNRLAQRPMRPQRLSSDPSLATRQHVKPTVDPLTTEQDSIDAPSSAVVSEFSAQASPQPPHPESAPPTRTRAPPPPLDLATGQSSPADSPPPESGSHWSSGTEDDRFPAHALSWDDADGDDSGDAGPTGSLSGDSTSRAARMRRQGQRSLSGSQRSLLEGEAFGPVNQEFHDAALSPGLVNSMPGISSAVGLQDRERGQELSNGSGAGGASGGVSRRLIDGWGFRKKSGVSAANSASLSSPARTTKERNREKPRDSESERGQLVESGNTSSGANGPSQAMPGSARAKKRGKLSKE